MSLPNRILSSFFCSSKTPALNGRIKSRRLEWSAYARYASPTKFGALSGALSSSPPAVLLKPAHVLGGARSAFRQVRTQSQDSTRHGEAASKIYRFADIKDMALRPSKDRILIDTREPSELQKTGHIPTAINIPITSAPDSLFISDDAFEDRFGFERPSKDKEVVFYCRAGVRSKAAAELAKQGGWKIVGEYPGSWIDWEKMGGDKEGN